VRPANPFGGTFVDRLVDQLLGYLLLARGRVLMAAPVTNYLCGIYAGLNVMRAAPTPANAATLIDGVCAVFNVLAEEMERPVTDSANGGPGNTARSLLFDALAEGGAAAVRTSRGALQAVKATLEGKQQDAVAVSMHDGVLLAFAFGILARRRVDLFGLCAMTLSTGNTIIGLRNRVSFISDPTTAANGQALEILYHASHFTSFLDLAHI